jgi:hypothetical protein
MITLQEDYLADRTARIWPGLAKRPEPHVPCRTSHTADCHKSLRMMTPVLSDGHASMRRVPHRRIACLVRTARPALRVVPGYHSPHGGASLDARGRLGWHGRNAVP